MTTYAFPPSGLTSTPGRPVPRCVTDLSGFFDPDYSSRSFQLANLGYIAGGGTVYRPGQDYRSLTLSRTECLLVESRHGDTYLATRDALRLYLDREGLPMIAELEDDDRLRRARQ